MSVLIKGMEMPKNCKECPFSDHEAWCLLPGDWRERYYCPDDERSDDCPLIEIPTPHGRLIDADKLMEEVYPFVAFGSVDYAELKRIAKTMEAVIEAEE